MLVITNDGINVGEITFYWSLLYLIENDESRERRYQIRSIKLINSH